MTIFRRRHYEAIAEICRVLSAHCDENRKIDHNAFVRELRDLFMRDNPRFDVDRFETACVPKKG